MEERKVKPKSRSSPTSRRLRRPRYDEPDNEVHYHKYIDENGREYNGDHPDRHRPRSRRDSDDEREIHYHYYYEPPRYQKKRSSKPGIAGALLLVTAILGLVFGSLMITGGWIVGDMGEGFSFMGMEDKADVYGRVTFTNGTPVDGANVSIVGEPLTAETDETGNYLIYNVPTGNHKIKVEFEGYNTIIYKTFIGPEESRWDDSSRQGKSADNKYDFTLTPGDDTIERGSYPPFELIRGIMTICGVLVLIFSVIVLLGGLYALKRKNFMIAILAAILGILTFGFFVGSLFALIALFILIISRDEFKRNDEMEGNMP